MILACHSSNHLPSLLNRVRGLCAFSRTVTHRSGGVSSIGVTVKQKFVNIAGERFGRLVAVEPKGVLSRKSRAMHWLCKCDCGKIITTSGLSLRQGCSTSCGCYAKESRQTQAALMRQKNQLLHGHGHYNSPTYRSWKSMLDRCECPGTNGFKNYGGKGITVCERWHSFKLFLQDMGERLPGMTIDRINPALNYSAENCRWATTIQQGRNRSTNHIINFNGQSLCLAAWDEKMNFPRGTVCRRFVTKGWSVEKTITTPLRKIW